MGDGGNFITDPFGGGGSSDYSPLELFSGSAAMGKPSNASQQQLKDAMMDQMALGRDLWNEGKGLRKDITSQLEDFTGGNYDVTSNPMFSPGKRAIEDIYGTSRENMISSTAPGGALQSGLSELEMSKAGNLTDLIGQIQQDMYNKAYGVGYGTPGQALAGMQSGAAGLSDIISGQMANAQQNAQGAGYMFGNLMNMFSSKPSESSTPAGGGGGGGTAGGGGGGMVP